METRIKPITKYPFNGKEFNSLKEVQNEVHNIIGENVIDVINRKIDIRHKDLFILLDILCSKEVRRVLVECLSVTYEDEDDKECNVLNLK